MNYYIYENWQAGPHKAVIHKADCRFCNNGQGLLKDYDRSHADWHGPFNNLEEAKTYSQNLENIIKHKVCLHCLKEIN